MKKLLLVSFRRACMTLSLMLAFGLHVYADEGIVLTLKDGREIGFVFSAKPKIITGTELTIISADGTEVVYDYAKVQKIHFGEAGTTGIENTSSDEKTGVSFRISDGTLYVTGLPVGERIGVYTLNGQQIARQKQSVDGDVLSIPLSAHGVLLVRTSNGISYKVLNP